MFSQISNDIDYYSVEKAKLRMLIGSTCIFVFSQTMRAMILKPISP